MESLNEIDRDIKNAILAEVPKVVSQIQNNFSQNPKAFFTDGVKGEIYTLFEEKNVIFRREVDNKMEEVKAHFHASMEGLQTKMGAGTNEMQALKQRFDILSQVPSPVPAPPLLDPQVPPMAEDINRC